jgi:PAS domain S-box-containing protein
MSAPVKIGHIVDKAGKSVLLPAVLDGIACEYAFVTVSDKDGLQEFLASGDADIFIYEDPVPALPVSEVITLVKQRDKPLPLILLTSARDEEKAVKLLAAGVDDYLVTDRLMRFPHALSAALANSRNESYSIQCEQLTTREKLFRTLTENSSDAIVLLNEKAIVTYASPSVETITGFSVSEYNGATIFDFLHEEDVQRGMEFFESVFKNPGIPIHNAFRHNGKNGRYIWVEGTIINLLHDENVRSFIINFRDITKRKDSEKLLIKSQANLSTILNNTDVAYVLTDRNFNTVSFNYRAAVAYQRELHKPLREGAYLVDYLPTSRRADTEAKYKLALQGQKIEYDISFTHPEGEVSWYHVNIVPVRHESEQVLGLIVSSEDVTARKHNELEKEKMTTEILQHNKNLEQFAYIISHNLRSPVANILGLANLLNDAPKMSASDLRKCLDGIVASVKKLDEIIIDLNFILERRREITEQKELVRFSSLVNDIRAIITTMTAKKDVVINTNLTVNAFFTVKSYLHSIFLNLITNSIKYRNPEKPTVIEIHTMKTSSRLFIIFQDNGIGIDLENHGDKVFGLYKKFHTHIEGKGMGLYMVKTQVEMLGGTIKVKSHVNVGTEFTIEFPLNTKNI